MEVRKAKGTENPADVFTKHLANAKTVDALLKLFGCEYRSGRPDGAPKLRPGEGTELGASLNAVDRCYDKGLSVDAQEVLEVEGGAAKDLVERDGYAFPAVKWEGCLVPEAWSYKQLCLPHLVAAMEATFPVAVASKGTVGADHVPEPCLLEQRGMEMVAREVSRGSRRRGILWVQSMRLSCRFLVLLGRVSVSFVREMRATAVS